jgi:hypothetical protein
VRVLRYPAGVLRLYGPVRLCPEPLDQINERTRTNPHISAPANGIRPKLPVRSFGAFSIMTGLRRGACNNNESASGGALLMTGSWQRPANNWESAGAGPPWRQARRTRLPESTRCATKGWFALCTKKPGAVSRRKPDYIYPACALMKKPIAGKSEIGAHFVQFQFPKYSDSGGWSQQKNARAGQSDPGFRV